MIEIEFTHKSGAVDETFSNDSRDIFVWEKTDRQGRSFLGMFNDGMPPMVELYRLAWITAKRLELIKGMDLDEYAATYTISVDLDQGTSAPDPTDATASPGG